MVIEPTTRRVTHLVVQPRRPAEPTRLVPVERARSDEQADGTIVLDGSVAEIGRLAPVREAAYLRLGEFPVADPDWEVGVQEMLALPYYQGIDTEPVRSASSPTE